MEIFHFLLGLTFVAVVKAFPDGAPVDACVKPRPNQPYHGQARPQPPETNPFQVLQSSAHYGPGAQITGKLNYFLSRLNLSN